LLWRKCFWRIAFVVLLFASIGFIPTVASAQIPWSNPSGSTNVMGWSNGQNLVGLFGSPILDGNHAFVFHPEAFQAGSTTQSQVVSDALLCSIISVGPVQELVVVAIAQYFIPPQGGTTTMRVEVTIGDLCFAPSPPCLASTYFLDDITAHNAGTGRLEYFLDYPLPCQCAQWQIQVRITLMVSTNPASPGAPMASATLTSVGKYLTIFAADVCPADIAPRPSFANPQGTNGIVDIDDLLTVITSWGKCPPTGPCFGDVAHSGSVDLDDLLAVINGWGPCAENVRR
jgi:hypothetical protein